MIADTYAEQINRRLRPADNPMYSALDLFSGCGGLALGFEAAGFKTTGMEMNEDCCSTYNNNLRGRCIQQVLTVETEFPEADIVIGGPPCQPFSVRGKQGGKFDARNGFPAFIKAIRDIHPRLWLLENVRGLLYKNRHYFNSVIKELAGMGYRVDYRILNAVDYGVPQNRERIIIVGHNGSFQYPTPLHDKVTAGEAIGEFASQFDAKSRFLTPSMDAYIAKYERASYCVEPRDLHLDRPARTLTCRNLAAPTSDMHRVKLSDGRRRQLTVREAARLQSFPDWFEFSGSETSVFYQIGNAVSPIFSLHLAEKFKETLDNLSQIAPKSNPRGRRVLIEHRMDV